MFVAAGFAPCVRVFREVQTKDPSSPKSPKSTGSLNQNTPGLDPTAQGSGYQQFRVQG